MVFSTTTAAGMGGLPERLLDLAGSSGVERVFARANLPLELIEDRSQRIPMSSMIRVFAESERVTGDPLFGLRVGLEMTGKELGHWFRYASQGDTLRAGIQRLSKAITLFQNGPSISLISLRTGGIMTYQVRRNSSAGYHAHSDHNLPLMLEFVRMYLGPDWHPRWLEVDYPDRGHGKDFADLVQSQPLFGRSILSLPLTVSELNTARSDAITADNAMCWAELEALMAETSNAFMTAVETCIMLEMLEGLPKLDSVASRMHISKRSLQRHLMHEGFSFREALARVQYRRALSLLQDTQLCVTEVAYRLGYNEVGSFSRAFKSWSGHAPSRRQISGTQQIGKGI